ncbi:DHH family phosphoesterase [Candidatus Woesearchaeota archaeon]|nr:DHH family phosphoesterase [Candidatus Woesearchaeota archaeon]MBW3021763.1 DHH family phosphoesterase [Candidatus Woesearchaeota archaeon]
MDAAIERENPQNSDDKYELFKQSLERAVTFFKSLDKKQPVRLVSHLDADGICAASIMVKLLNLENMRYSISIVTQLQNNIVEELRHEEYKNYIFTDLGSGQLSNIKQKLSDRNILILDHHEPEEVEDLPDNIIHINPHIQGIDGSLEISGSGVVYLFSKALTGKTDLAHIAVIGAIGDVQEKKGFQYLNNEILHEAIANEKIKVINGLRLFGCQTKPLHKVLEYSTDPFIPGVTGSESGAIQFLHDIGIKPKTESGWKKLVHLDDEDLKKLVTGIVMKRIDEVNPEDVLGPVYILKDEENESPTRDAKEFSTLLNACGRLNKASLGIGTCLGDEKIKKKAIQGLQDYKRELVNALRWYENNKDSEFVINGQGFIIINAQDNILPTIVGTLASILSKSNNIKENTYLMSLAQLIDNTTKVSLRVAGLKPSTDIDLRSIIKEIVDIVGGEAGGHQFAAGAVIPTEKEDEFIKVAKDVLEKKCLEEAVL